MNATKLSESVRLRKSNEGKRFFTFVMYSSHRSPPPLANSGKLLAAHREKNDLERGRHYSCVSCGGVEGWSKFKPETVFVNV